jgi:hypothetical protein
MIMDRGAVIAEVPRQWPWRGPFDLMTEQSRFDLAGLFVWPFFAFNGKRAAIRGSALELEST